MKILKKWVLFEILEKLINKRLGSVSEFYFVIILRLKRIIHSLGL